MSETNTPQLVRKHVEKAEWWTTGNRDKLQRQQTIPLDTASGGDQTPESTQLDKFLCEAEVHTEDQAEAYLTAYTRRHRNQGTKGFDLEPATTHRQIYPRFAHMFNLLEAAQSRKESNKQDDRIKNARLTWGAKFGEGSKNKIVVASV